MISRAFILILLCSIKLQSQMQPYDEVESIKPQKPEFRVNIDSVNHISVKQVDNFNYFNLNIGEQFLKNASFRGDFFSQDLFINNFSSQENTIFLDGISLKNNYISFLDLSILPMNMFDYYEVNHSSAENGYYSTGNSIDLKTNRDVDSTFTKLKLFGSQFFGNAAFNTQGKANYFYWDIRGNYQQSNDYLIPEITNSFEELPNSENNSLHLLTRFGLKDERSDISVLIFSENYERGLPVPMQFGLSDSKLNEYSTNIYSFQYRTDLSNNISLNGNFYYKVSKFNSNISDSVSLLANDIENPLSIDNTNNTYGGIITTFFDFYEYPDLELIFNYKRDVFNIFTSSFLKANRVETEDILISANQEYHFWENSSIAYSASLKNTNLVNADRERLFNSFNTYNFEFFYNQFLFDGLLLINNNITIKNIPPLIDNFYPFLNFVENDYPNEVENIIQYSSKFVFAPLGKFSFFGKIIFNRIDNRYFLNDEINEFYQVGSENYLGAEVGFDYNSNNLKVNSNFMYNDISQNLAFTRNLLIPKINSNTQVTYYFPFHMSISLEHRFESERKIFFNDEFQNLESFNLINVVLNQKFYKNHFINLRFNNITNELYYLNYGIPAPGFFVSGGININF